MKIYSVEITSRCNLKCSYCPQPEMNRAKEHMPLSLFERILDYPFANDIVIGHMFGEALLHPDLLEMTRLCRRRGLGFGFSTNAVAMTEPLLQQLLDAGLAWLVISFHNRHGRFWYDYLKATHPQLPVYPSELSLLHDWGGQIDTAQSRNRTKPIRPGYAGENPGSDCIFHAKQWGTISAQGQLLACCLDAEAKSSIGPILDLSVTDFERMPNDIYFDLCRACPKRGPSEEVEAEAAFLREAAADALDRMRARSAQPTAETAS